MHPRASETRGLGPRACALRSPTTYARVREPLECARRSHWRLRGFARFLANLATGRVAATETAESSRSPVVRRRRATDSQTPDDDDTAHDTENSSHIMPPEGQSCRPLSRFAHSFSWSRAKQHSVRLSANLMVLQGRRLHRCSSATNDDRRAAPISTISRFCGHPSGGTRLANGERNGAPTPGKTTWESRR